MEEENKNKRKIHITPEMLKEFKEEYAIMAEEEVKQKAERDAILFGDSYIMHMDRESCLKAFLGPQYIPTSEMEGFKPGQIAMLKTQCFDDLVEFDTVIHRDGVDKNLRCMTVAHMYVDDTYNLPEPPDATVIEVIQSVDYERLNRIVDCFSYSHRISDALIMNYMMQEKEGKNNDINTGKVGYRCSIPYNNGMYNTNHNENVPARGRRFRHH